MTQPTATPGADASSTSTTTTTPAGGSDDPVTGSGVPDDSAVTVTPLGTTPTEPSTPAPPSPQPPGPPPTPKDPPEPRPTPPPAGEKPPSGSLARKPLSEFPPEVREYVGQLRKEAGDNRVQARAAEKTAEETGARLQQFVDGFAKVMGLTPDTEAEQVTPEQLTGQLGEERDAHRRTRVELETFRAALRSGADADALLDSRSFAEKIHELDPASPSFAKQVTAAIDAAVAANPKFRAAVQAAPPPPPSGGEFTGGPGERRTDDEMSIDDHLRVINTPEAVGPR